MNAQARDLVVGMVGAKSLPTCCDLCRKPLNDANVYSPFATVCKQCADQAEIDMEGYGTGIGCDGRRMH